MVHTSLRTWPMGWICPRHNTPPGRNRLFEKLPDRNAITTWIKGLPGLPGNLLRFSLRVLFRFLGKNNGLVLASAVAYNTLLSLIPLLALVLILFSSFWETTDLLATIEAELFLIVPGQADAITEVLTEFMEQIEVIGIIGFAVLLFFSTIAFRVLEAAMAVLFDMPSDKEKRSFWVSALIPYAFISILGLGIVAITAGTSLLDAIPREAFEIPFLNLQISIDAATSASFYISGLIGLVILFTAVYLIIPHQKIPLRRALIGGLTATLLWELVRYVLVWYFTQLSLVNVFYGSLATVIIVLLSLEVAALILLLGAQVIADLERAARAKVPWHQGPLLARSAPESDDLLDIHSEDQRPTTRIRTHRRITPPDDS